MNKEQYWLIYYLYFGIFVGSTLTVLLGEFIGVYTVLGIVLVGAFLFMVYSLGSGRLLKTTDKGTQLAIQESKGEGMSR